MKNLQNKVAVITGAASGIGRELAWQLAEEGCRLVLTDIRDDELQKTVAKMNLDESRLATYVLDVTDKDAMEKLAQEVNDKFQQVDIVINNAGISSSGSIEDHSYDDFKTVIDINLWGVIYGSKAFLPFLRQQKQSSLVNISSINGIFPFPNGGPYNISKYAVLGLNETLMMELKDSPVQLLSVHPGGVKTNIVNYGINQTEAMQKSFDEIAITEPSKAAKEIIIGIKKRKAQIFIGPDAKFMQFIKRLSPRAAIPLSLYMYNKMFSK